MKLSEFLKYNISLKVDMLCTLYHYYSVNETYNYYVDNKKYTLLDKLNLILKLFNNLGVEDNLYK